MSCQAGISYTDFHNYAYIWERLLLKELKTLDMGTRLFDNATFICMIRDRKIFQRFFESATVERSKVSALTDLMTTPLCVCNYENKCNVI